MGGKTGDEIKKVWKAFKQNPTDQVLRNQLIERYFPLVRYHAGRLWDKLPDAVDINDLITAGVFGMIRAIDNFDVERGVKFETFSVARIRGAMLDELRKMDWVPRLVRNRASKLAAAQQAVEEQQGRPATDAEIADKMNLTPEAFRKLKQEATAKGQLSLSKKLKQPAGYQAACVGDIIQDLKGEAPLANIQDRDLMRLVTQGLNRNERLLVILYYYERLTMRQIGESLGLTESRISQMHKDIVKRLKKRLRLRRSEFLN